MTQKPHTQKNILVVEDEQALSDALQHQIGKLGYIIATAKNGSEGLARAEELHPDLILLDIVMPVMDGITMLKELRKTEWGKQVPVIILSNTADAQHMSEALNNHVYEFLVKTDWNILDIVGKVETILGH